MCVIIGRRAVGCVRAVATKQMRWMGNEDGRRRTRCACGIRVLKSVSLTASAGIGLERVLVGSRSLPAYLLAICLAASSIWIAQHLPMLAVAYAAAPMSRTTPSLVRGTLTGINTGNKRRTCAAKTDSANQTIKLQHSRSMCNCMRILRI